jgi:hypothetical protein
MSTRRADQEKQVSTVMLVVFATGLLGMLIVEMILATSATRYTLITDFTSKANLANVLPYFFAYLVLGGAGLAGTLGLVQVYGQGAGLVTEFVRYCAVAYFAIRYWLWSAVWIVQHKVTLLTDQPTNPPDELLTIYDAFDAVWALPSWGGIGPAVFLFAGVAWLLNRGARLLPRLGAALFALLALSQLLSLVLIGMSGAVIVNTSSASFAFFNDAAFNVGRVVAFIVAAAALISERGVFRRTRRTG